MDEPTIQRARSGDRAAQSALLRALQDPWHRMALALLHDGERARDATQEAALRLLRGLPRFDGRSRFRTWAIGILINVVREMRRRSGRDGRPSVRLTESQAMPDEAAERAEDRAALRRALADLPERQREAVVLRYLEGLSVEETAGAMGCAAGTVKATVHQALRALRAALTRAAGHGQER